MHLAFLTLWFPSLPIAFFLPITKWPNILLLNSNFVLFKRFSSPSNTSLSQLQQVHHSKTSQRTKKEMAMWEKQTHKPKRKVPSFSSSLLDAIYHSTDESIEDTTHNRRRNSSQVEEEIESLRRAIQVEKWMENYSTTTTPRHFPSNSGSSTDSSFFSSSETESSASKSTPRTSLFTTQKPKTERPIKNLQLDTIPKREGRFTRTKSKAMKIYGDLKKVKEPISPGGKIANFLNSIFSPRNLKNNQGLYDWSSIRKSRSMKDAPTCSLASRSCLSKNPSAGGNKSKRSVRFCPVSVIVDEDCQKNVCFDENSVSSSMAAVGSQFIRRNIDSFRVHEAKNIRKHHGFREIYDNESDVDDKSCASSDLFELENIGRVGIGAYEEELPVYGTTSLEMNQAIASGLVV